MQQASQAATQHIKSGASCLLCGALGDCSRCGGKHTVHRILATGERFCERGAAYGCNRPVSA